MFYPLEINGTKYLICKLPDQPFSTLHDPDTKKMVGQWNNDAAQYEIFPTTLIAPQNDVAPQNDDMTDKQFEQHMRQLIASGAAFTIMD